MLDEFEQLRGPLASTPASTPAQTIGPWHRVGLASLLMVCGWWQGMTDGTADGIGQPSDVFSFAVVSWECLTMSRPWKDFTSIIQVCHDVYDT